MDCKGVRRVISCMGLGLLKELKFLKVCLQTKIYRHFQQRVSLNIN